MLFLVVVKTEISAFLLAVSQVAFQEYGLAPAMRLYSSLFLQSQQETFSHCEFSFRKGLDVLLNGSLS